MFFRHPEGPQAPPPRAPRGLLGGLGGALGDPLGGLGGHFGGPRGPFRGNFWRTGGLAKSLVLLYKLLHFGCPRGPGGTSGEARWRRGRAEGRRRDTREPEKGRSVTSGHLRAGRRGPKGSQGCHRAPQGVPQEPLGGPWGPSGCLKVTTPIGFWHPPFATKT